MKIAPCPVFRLPSAVLEQGLPLVASWGTAVVQGEGGSGGNFLSHHKDAGQRLFEALLYIFFYKAN